MARIRTIKPEFPQSESMGRVSRDARLLFVMLWTICDDTGRTRAASRMLASVLFPYDDDATQKIPEWLMELEREHSLKVYTVDGNTYLQILKWDEHQKIDHPSKSKFPPIPQQVKSRSKSRPQSEFVAKSHENFADPREDVASNGEILGEDQGPRTKDQGREVSKNEEAQAPLVAARPKAEFPEWWPTEAWAGFVEMRRKIKKPLTDRAAKMFIPKLDKLRADGHDPAAVLDQSTLADWQDVYPLKSANGSGSHRTRAGPMDIPAPLLPTDVVIPARKIQ